MPRNSTSFFANELIERGCTLLRQGKIEAAVEKLQKGLHLNPRDHSAWSILSLAYQAQGEMSAAMESCEKALELQPQDAHKHYSKGLLLSRGEEYGAAIACFEQAIELKHGYYLDAWHQKALAQSNLNQYQEAVESYDNALQIKRNDPELLVEQSLSFYRLGNLKVALGACEEALSHQVDYLPAVKKKGLYLASLGRNEAALACFSKVLSVTPDDGEALYNQACVFSTQNKCDQAIESLILALAHQPDWVKGLNDDDSFNNLRQDTRFQRLIESATS